MGNKKKPAGVVLLVSLLFISALHAVNPRQYVDEGLQLYSKEHYYKAIDSFRRAIDNNPFYGDAYRYLAQVYFDMKEYDLSLDNAMSALKFSHKDIRAMLIIGRSYRELDKYKEAESFLLKVKKQFPSSAPVYRDLGELYLLMNRKDQAKRMLDKALRLDSGDWRNYTSLAHYYEFLEDDAQAEHYYQKSFSLNSRERVSYINLAGFYYQTGKLDQAIALLEKGETLFENFISGVTLLGDSYLRKKDYRQALEKYLWLETKLPAEDKKTLARLYFKIALASEQGKASQVVRYYQKALELDRENHLYRYSMEDFILNNFDIKDPLRKQVALYHLESAKKAYKEGSRDMYFYHLKRAVYIYPFLASAREELVRFYERQSDLEQAYSELKGLFKVDNSTSVRDKLENYEWKISRNQITLDRLQIYEFKAYFVTEELPGKIDDVMSHLAVYQSRNHDKFKLYPFTFRKTEGLNRIIQNVREKKYNFFVIAHLTDDGNTVSFVLYDRLGKRLAQTSMYYDEARLEQTMNRLYRWLDGYFPYIGVVKEKLTAKRFKISMGQFQDLKKGDVVQAIDLDDGGETAGDFKVLSSQVNVSEIEILTNKSFDINDFGSYGIIKGESLNKKHLTKLKRILVY